MKDRLSLPRGFRRLRFAKLTLQFDGKTVDHVCDYAWLDPEAEAAYQEHVVLGAKHRSACVRFPAPPNTPVGHAARLGFREGELAKEAHTKRNPKSNGRVDPYDLDDHFKALGVTHEDSHA